MTAIEVVENSSDTTTDEYIYVALKANKVLRIKTEISIVVNSNGFEAS